jgi:hypothetical protein
MYSILLKSHPNENKGTKFIAGLSEPGPDAPSWRSGMDPSPFGHYGCEPHPANLSGRFKNLLDISTANQLSNTHTI